jgi:hypothetical protein
MKEMKLRRRRRKKKKKRERLNQQKVNDAI